MPLSIHPDRPRPPQRFSRPQVIANDFSLVRHRPRTVGRWVGLFAQTIGVPKPVSAKRIHRAIDDLMP